MQTVLKKIRWKNFLSTGDTWTEIDLATDLLTLFIGSNGAGKTTLLDALCFVLYGKPFRDINKDLLINDINQKGALVELWFSIGSNEYFIRRGIKPTVFEFYVNDVMQNKDAKMLDYQKVVTSIVRMDLKSFKQICLLGSRNFVPFMTLTASERRTVMEDVLDLDIFSRMNDINKAKIEAVETELDDIDDKIKDTQQELKFEKKRKDLAEENIAESILTLELKREGLQLDIGGLCLTRDDIQAEIADLQDKIKDIDRVKDRIDKWKMAKRRMKDAMISCDESIEFYNSHDSCPTCSQHIDNDFKDSVLRKTKEDRKTKQANFEESIDRITSLSNDLEKMVKINNKISELLNQVTVHNTVISSSLNSVQQMSNEINELQGRSITFDDSVIIELQNTLDSQTTLKNDLAKKLEYLKAAATVLKDSGIKAKIIKQYIPIINTSINKYLAMMNFPIKFELDEQFRESIRSRHKDKYVYGSFSEGEKLRIDLAILFAWRDIAKMRNTTSTNLLIMDEILDSSLDPNGVSDFMDVIKSLTNENNTIIISHKTDLNKDTFDRVMQFTKSNKKFSKYKVLK